MNDQPEDKTRAFDAFGGVSPKVPGQTESHTARAALDNWLKEQTEPPAWELLWQEIQAERALLIGPDGEVALNDLGQARTRRRWDWRKALYIAWMATPRKQRQPETFKKFCDLLGLSSTGTVRNWRRKDPEIDERIRALPKRMLVGHLADVYAALVAVATDPDPKAHPDRRLFLELMGEYNPKGTVMLTGDEERPVYVDLTHDLGKLTDTELDDLDRIAGRLSAHSGGEGPSSSD